MTRVSNECVKLLHVSTVGLDDMGKNDRREVSLLG